MKQPNVIVAGSQKSGTTSLCAALEQHPDCIVSDPKEPNHFSRKAWEDRPDLLDGYFHHASDEQILVDGTTTYMADPAIAERIHRLMGPETRIVFTLRSPVRRTWSGYLHMLKRGYEKRHADEVFLSLPDDLPTAIAQERRETEAAAKAGRLVFKPYTKLYDDYLWNHRYLGNSVFSEQVAYFERYFSPDRMLVLLFEDLISDFPTQAAKLSHFLGIDPAPLPASLPRENTTRMPDVSTPWGWLDAQARRIKNGHFTLVRRYEGQAPSHAPKEIEVKLRQLLSSETAFWSDRLNRDLSALGW